MNGFLNDISLKIIDKKVKVGFTAGIASLFILTLTKGGYLHPSDIFMYIEIILPCIFAITAIFIFKDDCTEEIHNMVMIYNKKKYNKVLLIRILRFLGISLIIFLGLTVVSVFASKNAEYHIFKEGVKLDLSVIGLFIRSYSNTIFLSMLPLFILKVSKNIFVAGGFCTFYIFQEIGSEGTYTNPVNLFVSYSQRSVYTQEVFLLNRLFFIVLSVIFIVYIVKKKN